VSIIVRPAGGSVARHVNLLVPSTREDCAAGAIIMEPTEYPPMSGSNTICVATVLLETGMVPMQEPETRFRLDMPGGVIEVRAECRDGKCLSIAFRNAPAFAERLDADIEVEGLGTLKVDIAYGGMFYAIVDAAALGFSVTPDEAREIAVAGEKVRRAAREQLDVVHPEFDNVRGVSIVQFAMPFQGPGKVTRNTCIVSPGRSDRSPTGTGTSARMAVLHARGQMKEGEVLIHESIIGSRFTGRIVGLTEIAGRKAIVPEITGRAWITGEHNYYLDPTDPYPQGYVLSDTWGTSTSVTQ
ncbi:hypothetical protein EOA37_28335, partial [Mesorhizobium sp. M2A.F.Ca.ET.015.02.1.1]|uniref:proline racemase family protein n=1 Tax=Mesorhizobium sp. M2A.F.Ca.ET.015.02.1.1 TaxID=2496758 RepID=UPI000FC9DEF7